MRVLGMFAKRPVLGGVKSRLGQDIGAPAALAFYQACLADLAERFAETAASRWLGYAPATSAAEDWFQTFSAGRYQLWPQPDADLGHRIEAFFHWTLESLQQQVVLIGSDSPEMSSARIEAAFRALDQHDLVLGPVADGGYDLIGLRRCPVGWLNGIRWSTAWTLADTVSAADRHRLSLQLLPLGADIDTVDDLAALWGRSRHNPGAIASRTQAWLAEWAASSSAGRGDP